MKTRSIGTTQIRTRAPYFVVLALLAVLAAACGEGGEVTDDSLDGSRWEMTSVWDGSDLTAAHLTTIATIEFSNGSAFGSTGCNRYQSAYSIDSDSISFGDPIQPGSACNPDHVPQGDAFIQAMQASTGFVLTAESLELTDAGGVAQLHFRPASELPLVGVTWLVAWYGGGASPLQGTQISLAFRSDGTLGGIAGCNDYLADYQVDGDKLVIESIAHTEMACLDPDGVMTQETDYLNAIKQTDAFATTLTGLELLDPDGNPVAEYRFGGRIR